MKNNILKLGLIELIFTIYILVLIILQITKITSITPILNIAFFIKYTLIFLYYIVNNLNFSCKKILFNYFIFHNHTNFGE